MGEQPEAPEESVSPTLDNQQEWEEKNDLDPLGAPKTWTLGEDNGVPDPHSVEVLHDATDDRKTILTNRSCSFLANLNRRFAARFQAILTFEGEPAPSESIAENWKAAIAEALVSGRVADLVGPASGEAFLSGVQATRGTYIAQLSEGWEDIMDAHRNIRQLLAGVRYYRTKGQPEPDALEGDANVSLRLRPMNEVDEKLILHRRPMACALRDFGLYAFFNGPAVQVRGETLDVTIRDVNNVEIAELWRDIFEYTEDVLELPGGTLTATLEISNGAGVEQAEDIAYISRMFANGLTIDKEGFLASGSSASDYKKAANKIGALCKKVGLCAIAPLAYSVTAEEPSEKDIASAVKEFESQKSLGYTTTQVDHAGLLKHGIQVFKHY